MSFLNHFKFIYNPQMFGSYWREVRSLLIYHILKPLQADG